MVRTETKTLIDCVDFVIIRPNFYTMSNLADLFHSIQLFVLNE